MGINYVTRETVLEQETRRDIYECVRAMPGTTIRHLKEETGKNEDTVRYHLRKLAENDLVEETSHAPQAHSRYFPADQDTEHSFEQAHALLETAKSENGQHILALLEAGPRSSGELADEAGCSQSTVTHHTKRLKEAGLVERERNGRRVQFLPTSSLKAVTAEYI